MKTLTLLSVVFASIAPLISAHANVVVKTVEYKDGSTVLEGKVAYVLGF
jgi:hypothetical protein